MTQIDSHMHLVYSHNFYYDFAIVSTIIPDGRLHSDIHTHAHV